MYQYKRRVINILPRCNTGPWSHENQRIDNLFTAVLQMLEFRVRMHTKYFGRIDRREVIDATIQIIKLNVIWWRSKHLQTNAKNFQSEEEHPICSSGKDS